MNALKLAVRASTRSRLNSRRYLMRFDRATRTVFGKPTTCCSTLAPVWIAFKDIVRLNRGLVSRACWHDYLQGRCKKPSRMIDVMRNRQHPLFFQAGFHRRLRYRNWHDSTDKQQHWTDSVRTLRAEGVHERLGAGRGRQAHQNFNGLSVVDISIKRHQDDKSLIIALICSYTTIESSNRCNST